MPDPRPGLRQLLSRRRLVGAGLAWPALAAAQAPWPQRAVTLVVPFAPGGPVDNAARPLAEGLRRQLGQAVIIENRPGAGGVVGTRQVAQARPDGYTLLVGSPGPLTIAPAASPDAPDPLRVLAPVALIAESPQVLVVPPSSPAATLDAFVALARRRELNLGSAGIGTTPHLVVELLRERSGADLTHVPFRGGAPAVTALLGGQIQMVSAFISEVAPFAADNRVRLLAVTSDQRQPGLPDVPTLREGGIDLAVYAWFGLHGPAGVPAPIVARLHQAIATGLAEPATQQRLAAIGINPAPMSTAEFAASQQSELELYGRLRGRVTLE